MSGGRGITLGQDQELFDLVTQLNSKAPADIALQATLLLVHTLSETINAKTTNLPTDPAVESQIQAKLDLIKAQTDIIITDPSTATALSAVKAIIDIIAIDTGTTIPAQLSAFSTCSEIIKNYLYTWERGFEKSATPNGEIHVAVPLGAGVGAFRINAGNNDWGNWGLLIGSGDTPFEAGKTVFHVNQISISAAQRTATYFIQLGFGETGAEALSAKTYADIIFTPQTVQGKPEALTVITKRVPSGTKVWARTKCPGQNLGTLDLYPKFHEDDA